MSKIVSYGRKVVLFTLCTLALLLFPWTAYAEPLPLNLIDERMAEIAGSYEVGEILSKDDAAFVAEHASTGGLGGLEMTPLASTQVGRSFSKYGVSAYLSGSLWHNGVGYYSWGGDLSGRITSGAVPQKMTLNVSLSAYGINTNGETFLAVKDNASNTSYNKQNVYLYFEKSYVGVTAIYYLTSSLSVTTSSGAYFSFEGNW